MRRMVLSLILAVLLSGCAETGQLLPTGVDLGQVTLAITLGVDEGKTLPIRVTASGAPLESEGGTEPPAILSAEGANVYDACRSAGRRGTDTLLYSHIRDCVVGSALTERSWRGLLDDLERNSEMRMDTRVWVCPEDGADALIESCAEERSSAAERLDAVARGFLADSQGKPCTLLELMEALCEGDSVLIPALKKGTGSDDLVYAGMGWLKDGVLGGVLTIDESRGACILTHYGDGGTVILDGTSSRPTAVSMLDTACRVLPVWQDERLTGVTVYVEGSGALAEAGMTDLNDREQERRWNAALGQALAALCAEAVHASQHAEADFLGLERALCLADPLRAEQIRAQWDGAFADLDIRVEACGTIRHSYNLGPESRERISENIR